MCIHIHIRYVRSSLAVVVYFIVKSESKSSPGTDFAAEDMKENIPVIFAYIATNFESNRIATKRRLFEISNTNGIFVPSVVGITD